jgi:hypothetical protein
MKQINLIFLLIFLCSCSNTGIYGELAQAIKELTSKPKDLNKEKFLESPYANIQARIGRSQNSLIILEEVQDDILKWTSSNLVKIYTKNGYVVRLTGLENNLSKIVLDNDHPFSKGDLSDISDKVFTSYYNFSNPNLFDLPVRTKFIYVGKEEINYLGDNLIARKYEEQSLGNLINWKFKNIFWISEENNILIKSKQYFTPKNPEIYIKVGNKYEKPD